MTRGEHQASVSDKTSDSVGEGEVDGCFVFVCSWDVLSSWLFQPFSILLPCSHGSSFVLPSYVLSHVFFFFFFFFLVLPSVLLLRSSFRFSFSFSLVLLFSWLLKCFAVDLVATKMMRHMFDAHIILGLCWHSIFAWPFNEDLNNVRETCKP